MPELEKILEEIIKKSFCVEIREYESETLVDMGGSYPLRAFWNGKKFTDGWSALDVKAWMPLPDPYHPERSENHDGE